MNQQDTTRSAHAFPAAEQKACACACGPACKCGPDCACAPGKTCTPSCGCSK